MALNLPKTYNQLLEIIHFSEADRMVSLKRIFDRDITDNACFNFRGKLIRPFKVDGTPSINTLFGHLTFRTEVLTDEKGKKIKSRSTFDFKRSERLHWVRYHIEEKNKAMIEVFSYLDRIGGRDVVRTYIFDESEKYVIVLEPQRSKTDYYLITAYYLTEEEGGIKQINRKSKKRLPDIH